MTHTTRARSEAGFSLVEILVAMMIFLVGIGGILALLGTGLSLHRDGLSLAAGVREVDEIERRIAADVASGALWDEAEGGWQDVPPTRLPSGTWYDAALEPEIGNEREGSVLVFVRIGGRTRDLPSARPLPLVVDPLPGVVDGAARYRRRQTSR